MAKVLDSKKIHMGCFIGDYFKTAIGTLLNTGSVMDLARCFHAMVFPPKTIKPFTWFIKGKHQKVNLDKFFETGETSKRKKRASTLNS
ncbi:MAG: hypothetical protein CM1200mP33_6870 [Chloroflexota bacterium]|nr:MAG: hypothetical protein CM1200mP33_6870 [Chloroflexota bacterium]